MQECYAHRQAAPVTQANRPYTAAEQALIDQLAHRSVRKTEIAALFPDRTVAAVKQRINAARHRLGLIEPQAPHSRKSDDGGVTMLHPDDPGVNDDWWARNRLAHRLGSAALLAALRAA